jgi:protein-tyrosine-phosphatase/DNA-binding transcriptional ArsR family regulator
VLPRRQAAPPPFVQLVGHPVRWRLLSELVRSDRRVRELVTLIDQRQNLVSYHLGKLRAANLVTAQRSSADGRDTYYHLNLTRCMESLAATGAALHPALRFDPALTTTTTAEATTGLRDTRCRVLFLCSGNSARSPMAEALLRHRAGDRVEVVSAGSHPRALHPNAVRVLHAHGIDLSGRQPQHLSAVAGQHFDYVISLCDRVREVCPEFPGRPTLIHWSIPDPASAADTASYSAFCRTAAELDTRIRFLLPVLDPSRHMEVS